MDAEQGQEPPKRLAGVALTGSDMVFGLRRDQTDIKSRDRVFIDTGPSGVIST